MKRNEIIADANQQDERFIIKRSGRQVAYEPSKIRKAINSANVEEARVDKQLTSEQIEEVVDILTSVVFHSRRALSVEEIQDLVQEGTFGIYTAANKFDADMGYNFSTYAVHWIKQAIVRTLHTKNRMIKIPVNLEEDIAHIKRILRKENISVEYDNIDISELVKTSGLSKERVKRALSIVNPISYDIPISAEEGEDKDLLSFIADTKDMEKDVLLEDARKSIDELMDSCLSEKEKAVIKRRFGLNNSNDEACTLQTVATEMGVTRECIRQIEIRAMKKLKAKIRKKHLKRDDFI